MGEIRAIDDTEVDAVLDLITAQQADPATGTCYLGTERNDLRLELEDLGSAWPDSVLVAIDEGRVVGAALADTDIELGRSWILGPWVTKGWSTWARPLLEAAVATCPPEIVAHEISADLANVRMAALAEQLGWKASVPNHVFVLSAGASTDWPPDDPRVRLPRADDFAAIDPLHNAEFPDTYLPTRQMLTDGIAGERIVAVSEADDGRFLGYASGRVQPGGAGYRDCIAIDPAARGIGAGLGLLVTISRRIVAASPQHNVNLTVQQHRSDAVALYRKLGFELETTIVGYSSPTLTRTEP